MQRTLIFLTFLLAASPFVDAQPATTQPQQPITRPVDHSISGTFLKLEGRVLTYRPLPPGWHPGDPETLEPTSLVIDEHTVITVNGQPAKPPTMKPGLFMMYWPMPAKGKRPAKTVLDLQTPPVVGDFLRLEGDGIIVLKVVSGGEVGKEVKLTTNAKTLIPLIPDKPPQQPVNIKPSDLKAGMRSIVKTAPNGTLILVTRVVSERPASQPSSP